MARQDCEALSKALAGTAASSATTLLVQDTAHRTSGTSALRPGAALGLLALLPQALPPPALAGGEGGGGAGERRAALQLLAVTAEGLCYPSLDDAAAALLNAAQQQCAGLSFEVAASADPSSGDLAVDEAARVGRASGGAMTLHLRWPNVRCCLARRPCVAKTSAVTG